MDDKSRAVHRKKDPNPEDTEPSGISFPTPIDTTPTALRRHNTSSHPWIKHAKSHKSHSTPVGLRRRRKAKLYKIKKRKEDKQHSG